MIDLTYVGGDVQSWVETVIGCRECPGTRAVPAVESPVMADPDSGRASDIWHLLIGPPRSARGSGKERITPIEGLSALSLDALTSVAYGPEAIILVLAVAGAGALHLILPITIAIVALLAILVFSYRQVIDAYPMGGGAYAVSRANFGAHTSLVAAASLVVDYTLTVAVSIAAGVAGLQSAFPSLDGATVPLCLGILLFIMVLNLRGLGETARAFLLPTMVFIVGLLAIIAIGLIHPLGLDQAQQGTSQLPTTGLKAVTILLVLKAFSAGCSALTGVEAIANGVPLFREPRAVRAKRTEMLLGIILGAMLIGLAVLARRWHIGPRSGQTVLSQIMSMAVGRSWAYYLVTITITIVLALAANTSFGGLPVLASLVARDNYLPHLFTIRGDRQTFANGIVVLAGLAGVLLVVVGGNTNTLIPLFAIGVFIGFTLSQAGLVVHWRRTRPPHWRWRATINGTGACITAVATIVFLVSKFTEGAWVVVIAVPAFVLLFLRIHAYYERARKELRIDETPMKPVSKRTIVIVPVNRISRLTEHALGEAKSLGQEVIAVTVILRGGDEGTRYVDSLRRQWRRWDPGVPLHVLHNDYASVVQPIVGFIDDLRREHPDDQIVVLIPVIRPDKFRYRLLHNQIDLVLSSALRDRDDVVVARVSVPLEPETPAAADPNPG
jgi:amino acid transporter